MATIPELDARLTVVEEEVASLSAQVERLGADMDTFWLLTFGALVFMMQTGFGLLESGSVRSKNAVNILFKNTLDVCIGAIGWYLLGFAFAYGNHGTFIGYRYFALTNVGCDDDTCESYQIWFFQFTFCATAATIASGAMAERTQLVAYLLFTFFLTAFIYPVVVHWQWSSTGWLSPFKDDTLIGTNNFLDFAGCGAVHMVGGFAGLMGAILLGPRLGRFDNDGPKPQGHNLVFVALGTLILWFGWYGFNPGSTLGASGGFSSVAALAAVNTTLSPAFAAAATLIINVAVDRQMNLGVVLNGLLGGLVSITSGCAIVDGWGAVIIGVIAGLLEYGSSKLLIKLKVDDPLDAFPVHGICGMWGLLSVGAFATHQGICDAYKDGLQGGDCPDIDFGFIKGGGGMQLGAQLTGLVVIAAWTAALSGVLFGILRLIKLLRVPVEEERMGLDEAKHGGHAYPEHSLIMRTLASKVMTSQGDD
mmetsp:Transcript_49192/g.123666  ORF Transcript_49192/g.123666 Transcript_49192/m.123666 type:complete len:477 (-) Transcript_49192:59-1489(-)|eukprot:CAMPEP_0177685334 /NCGR_PEP_ID=MMETSP0447-20121125/32971_1 /TAXON_ID=0 /ORGANISM="Stygamoeba regulata, Strain BSH-02190019" /LENGTH=476 /DNA_ID=CAMNT_0019195365 /DNA_START=291 /DNA_END=1721 /DNA_ORIENTATION=-